VADRTIVLATNKRHAVRGLTVVNPQEFSAYQEDNDDLTYIVDMSSYLDGATISSVTRTPTGVTVSNTSNTTTRITQRLKGFGHVDFKVTTSSGDIEEFRIKIQPRAGSAFFLPNIASVPQNTAQFFETVAQAQATNPGDSVNYIWVSGYTSAADGRGGLYKRTTSASNLDTFTTANGVIFERSYYKTTISALPADDGSAHATIDTSFSGDLKGVRFPVYHKVTGAGTLGQPTTGYESIPEAMPFYVWLDNESGWNESTTGNDGRTGVAALRVRLQNDGQGDVYGLWVTGGISSTRSGSTSFLANPAAVIVGGNLAASADGAYLNPGEFLLSDNGTRDIAAVGWVVNLNRTVTTGAKDVFWAGYKVQSIGSGSVDVAYNAKGPFRFGLDLSFCDFGANQAAITLKADQRIYGNVTATDPSGLSRYPSAVSTTYFTYSSSLTAWHFVTGNNSALQIYSNQVISPLAIRSDVEYRISATKVVGARDTGWTAMTGTTNKATSYDTATVTTAQLAGRVMALQAALTTHGLIGA